MRSDFELVLVRKVTTPSRMDVTDAPTNGRFEMALPVKNDGHTHKHSIEYMSGAVEGLPHEVMAREGSCSLIHECRR